MSQRPHTYIPVAGTNRYVVTSAESIPKGGAQPVDLPPDRVIVEVPDSIWIEVDLPGGDWRAAYRLASQEGVVIVAELRVFPAAEASGYGMWSVELAGRDAKVPRGGLSARLVKKIKIREVVQVFPEHLQPLWKLMGLDSPLPSLHRGAQRGQPEERLAALAADYIRLVEKGSTKPATVIAQHLNVPANRVYQQLQRAKLAGLYEPVGMGKIGGRLTVKGKRLAKARLQRIATGAAPAGKKVGSAVTKRHSRPR